MNYFYIPDICLNISLIAPKFTSATKEGKTHILPKISSTKPSVEGWPLIDDSDSLAQLELQLQQFEEKHVDLQTHKFFTLSNAFIQVIIIIIVATLVAFIIKYYLGQRRTLRQYRDQTTILQEENIQLQPINSLNRSHTEPALTIQVAAENERIQRVPSLTQITAPCTSTTE